MSNIDRFPLLRDRRPGAVLAVLGSTLMLGGCMGGESGTPVATRTVTRTITQTVTVPEAAPTATTATTPVAPAAEAAPQPTPTPTPASPGAAVATPEVPTAPPTTPPVPAAETPAPVPPAANRAARAPAPTPPVKLPAAPKGPVIALDPGHGPNRTIRDKHSRLKQIEYETKPEMRTVWSVANRVKLSLEHDGYRVVMLKKSLRENVTFRERANRAAAAGAKLAVSIHGDPTLADTGQIYPQKVGLYRGSRGSENTTVFTNARTANASQRFSRIFQDERQKIEGPDIVVKDNNFDNRSPIEPGNISMVQLFSPKIPWVYNEADLPGTVTSNFIARYSYALVNSIERAIPYDKG